MPEALIVGVYRRKNVSHVLRLLQPGLELGWGTAWWALDGADRSLEAVTVGEGPGHKFPLVNRALESAPTPRSWTIVTDDDVRFRRSNVVGFIRYCERAGLDIAQPARARGTDWSHDITIQLRLTRARLTSFVESGPLVAVASAWRDRVLPLPEERGMGWGVELDWLDLFEAGCRLGIVDALPVEHLGKAGAEYETAGMYRRLSAELAARGVESWGPLKYTVASWHRWQRRPPWLHDSP